MRWEEVVICQSIYRRIQKSLVEGKKKYFLGLYIAGVVVQHLPCTKPYIVWQYYSLYRRANPQNNKINTTTIGENNFWLNTTRNFFSQLFCFKFSRQTKKKNQFGLKIFFHYLQIKIGTANNNSSRIVQDKINDEIIYIYFCVSPLFFFYSPLFHI